MPSYLACQVSEVELLERAWVIRCVVDLDVHVLLGSRWQLVGLVVVVSIIIAVGSLSPAWGCSVSVFLSDSDSIVRLNERLAWNLVGLIY